MQSVSTETYKCLKNQCEQFLAQIDFFKNYTDICNDPYIFPRLALVRSLLDHIISNLS